MTFCPVSIEALSGFTEATAKDKTLLLLVGSSPVALK